MLRDFLVLTLLASAAAPADPLQPQPAAPNSRVAVGPRGDIRGLMRHSDYPAEAIARGEQGTVHVELSVNDRGEVAGCEVERSSGSAALDAQTCTVLSARAKFEPAKDEDGRPVAGTIQQRITWRLEDSVSTMPTENWAVRMVVTYHPDGRTSCKGELTGALKLSRQNVSAGGTAPDCREDERMSAELRRAGIVRPGETTIVTTERHFFRGRIAGSALPIAPSGDVVLGRQVLELSIAADGKVMNCREISFEGTAKSSPDPCLEINPFRPPVNSSGKPAPIMATLVTALSFHEGAPDNTAP